MGVWPIPIIHTSCFIDCSPCHRCDAISVTRSDCQELSEGGRLLSEAPYVTSWHNSDVCSPDRHGIQCTGVWWGFIADGGNTRRTPKELGMAAPSFKENVVILTGASSG